MYSHRKNGGKIVVNGINKSGGVCVWAHPYGGNGETKITIEKVEEILKLLVPLGLKGIECYYNLYTEKEISDLINLANKYELKISAGSDYHGFNKKVCLSQMCIEKDIFLNQADVTIINEFKNN